MANLVLVQMLDSWQYLAHVLGSLTLAESFAFNDLVEQLSTFGQLHNNMDVPVVNVALMELNDVWMVYLSEDL